MIALRILCRGGWAGASAECSGSRERPAPLTGIRHRLAMENTILGTIFLSWIAYATTVEMVAMPFGAVLRCPSAPVAALEPFRIANQYGLFAVMTRGRYEIEFQGSNDGRDLDAVSVSLSSRRMLNGAAADLCAVSAAVGLEFVVRVAGRLAE